MTTIASRQLPIEWKTTVQDEPLVLGPWAGLASDAGAKGISLRLERLENLEATIDHLFEVLLARGETQLLEDLCPYFGWIWPSARALTQYLLATPPEAGGAMKVLEVGCGLALPSLALAKVARLSKIVCSDYHPEVPAFLKRNMELNGVPSDRLEYRDMNWTSPRPDDDERYHWVVGSDILYEKNHPEIVADCLIRYARPSGRITIADPARPYLQQFVDGMRARGWLPKEAVLAVSDGQGGTKEVFVFDFKRP